jgi:hypothetical protein
LVAVRTEQPGIVEPGIGFRHDIGGEVVPHRVPLFVASPELIARRDIAELTNGSPDRIGIGRIVRRPKDRVPPRL